LRPIPTGHYPLVRRDSRQKFARRNQERAGRPKESWLSEIRFEIAKWKYHRYLAWLQKREHSSGLDGWAAVRRKDWWTGAPHERAARIVTARWLKHMSWRAFLNRISS
jgi:hypothetical protein